MNHLHHYPLVLKQVKVLDHHNNVVNRFPTMAEAMDYIGRNAPIWDTGDDIVCQWRPLEEYEAL